MWRRNPWKYSYVDIAGYAACGGEILTINENSKESNTNEIK